MHYIEVVSLRRGGQRSQTLTYHNDSLVEVGSIVEVPFGKKTALAVVINPTDKPDFETKPISKVIAEGIVPRELMRAAFWLYDYYAASIDQVFGLILPKGIQKKRRAAKASDKTTRRPNKKIRLTAEQSKTIKAIEANPELTHLIQGVTGSGKTQIYIELAAKAEAAGRSSLVLVPEISLTTQIVADFKNRFSKVFVTHSGLSEAQRHKIWQQITELKEPAVVVGPRSALFTPLSKIGLIVIDECHEDSYKQDTNPRYDARRVARILAFDHKAMFVMGSATPNIVDRYLADQRGQVHVLSQSIASAPQPDMTIVDSKDRDNYPVSSIISKPLHDALKATFEKDLQSMVFHNRRGTATIAMCTDCGWTALCPDCEVPLTLHRDTHDLKCHICGYRQKPPSQCPDCSNHDILYKGYGTKRIVDEIEKLLPGAKVARFDADSSKEASLVKRYQEVHDGKFDVIVGTQIIGKGLDLPKLQTVGVVAAESSLHLPDFTAAERTYQLLTQVAGRAGRRDKKAKIIIQSHQPDSQLLEMVKINNYEGLYRYELDHRETLNYPPFTYLMQLTCSYASREAARLAAEKKATQLINQPGLKVLGPTPAFYEKRAGRYRWTLVIKSKNRNRLQAIARQHGDRYWQADLDPVSLLK
ncbi:MAG: primosomal protein N' [Candidatus Saccharimonadales bacterium]|nr:primosomal protein N' [Candidatus Saccharimonadales bacterium]